ncbi:MAG: hypothetical protein EBW87_05935, partial [Burkholderiaceae bacterium]|nr:hypothetical protein [Burkholderiaceae bacterium]
MEPITVEGNVVPKPVVKTPVVSAPPIAKKVDAQTIEQIKAQFSPPVVETPVNPPIPTKETPLQIPEEVSQSTSYEIAQPSVPKYDLIDMEKVKTEAAKGVPTTTEDVLLGLIPLATSILAGGKGQGVDVAGQYYLGKAA